MKTSYRIAWNTHLLLFIILFILFVLFGVTSFLWNDVGIGIVFVLFALLSLFAYLISPQYVVFTDASVEIVYCFKQRLCIRWNDVREIYQMGTWFVGSSLPRYVIVYPEKEKLLFFVKAEIPKTGRTKKLINQYFRMKID